MRYTQISRKRLSPSEQLTESQLKCDDKGIGHVDEAEKYKMLIGVRFKYKGKSICIYKENTSIANFAIIDHIQPALFHINHRMIFSERKIVETYDYVIKISYCEMIKFKFIAMVTPDNSMANALEKLLWHVSKANNELFICLLTENDNITGVTFDDHDIKIDDWFEIRPFLAANLPIIAPKALIKNETAGLTFLWSHKADIPYVFAKNNKIEYDIFFKDGNCPEEKINKAQTFVKFIQKWSIWALLRFMSFFIFLKRILVNPGFFQNLFASATGLWLLQNISWRHLFSSIA